MSCLVAKPVVDGIEQALQGSVVVYRLNSNSAAGRKLASRFAIRFLPTLIVVDGAGQPILTQVGRLNKDAVLQAVAKAAAVSND